MAICTKYGVLYNCELVQTKTRMKPFKTLIMSMVWLTITFTF